MKNLTLPEKKAQLDELKAKAEAFVTEYNEADAYNQALAEGQEPEGEEPRKLSAIMVDIKKAERDYKQLAQEILYDECKATENPMYEAVKRLTYSVISAKAVKPDGVPNADYTILKVDDGTTYVDVVHFGAALKALDKWYPRMQRLHSDLHAFWSRRTKSKTGELEVSSQAAGLVMDKNLVSMTNLKAIEEYLQGQLQDIANGLFGDGKVAVEPRDGNWIYDKVTTPGKGKYGTRFISLDAKKHDFAILMTRALNRAITGGEYVMECGSYK